jgi:peptide alpha-N-acetyltransferase
VDNAANSKQNDELDYSDMTPAERKKAKNLARKKKKADGGSGDSGGGGGKDGMLSKTNTDGSGNKKKSAKPHVIDEDPDGKELLALDHLDEAKKFAAILVRHCPKRMSSWALQYDVSIRRGKMLLAMQVRDLVCTFRNFVYIILYVIYV